jgi:hypothetical protein
MSEAIEEIAEKKSESLIKWAKGRANWPVMLCRHETSAKPVAAYLDKIKLGSECIINANGVQVAKYSLRTPINRFVWRKLKGLRFSIDLMSDVPGIAKIDFDSLPKLTKANAKAWADKALMPYISEWKQSGHPEWLRQEETRSLVSRLTEQSDDLDEATDGMEISDRYASVLSVEFVVLTKKLLEEKTDTKERWQCLREVFRELTQLRRDDHRAVRTVIKRDRWNREVEREEEEGLERMDKEHKQHLIDICFSPMHNQAMAEGFGGGEYGKKMAELLHRIKFDLPWKDFRFDAEMSGKTHPNGIKPNPTESDLIRPNPTE